MGRHRRRRSAGKARFAHWKEQQERGVAVQMISEVRDPLATPRDFAKPIPVRHGNGYMATLAVPRDVEPTDAIEQMELEYRHAVAPEPPEPVETTLERDGFPIPAGATDVAAQTACRAESSAADAATRIAPSTVTADANAHAETASPTPAAESKGEPPVPIIIVRRPRRPMTPTAAPTFSLRRFALGCLAGTGAAAVILIALRTVFGS